MQPEARGEQPLESGARRVLVTGGSGAIGSDIVRALCRQGWSVTANFAHDELRAKALQNETGCALFQADVGDENAVEAMFAETGFHAVVHAAGVVRDALLLRQSVEQWRETLRVNADGAFLVTRAALQNLADGGRLILLASRVGQSGSVGQSSYSASKAAVIALMKCAAREGGDLGICVNAICPGLVPSSLTEPLNELRLEELRNRSVFHRLGTGSEVAGAVQWLISAEAAGVSGQVVHCDSRF